MFIKDIKLIFSDRRMLIVLGMLVIAAVTGLLFAKPYSASPKVRFGVVNDDGSQYSRMLIEYFRSSEGFSSYITLTEGSEAELSRMLQNNEIDLYLCIPAEFASRLMAIDNLPIRVYIDSSDTTKAVLYKNLLKSYGSYISSVQVNAQAVYDLMKQEGFSEDEVSDVNYSLSYDLIFTALGKDDFFEQVELERIEGVSLVNYYVSSAIVLAVLYTGLLAGLSFLRDIKSSASLRLITMGKGILRQYAARLMSYMLICGTVFTVLVTALSISGNMDYGIGSILFVLTGLLVSCAVFMAAACFTGTVAGYSIFSNMAVLLLTVVGGGIIPVMYLPETIVKIARFTPNYWFIRSML